MNIQNYQCIEYVINFFFKIQIVHFDSDLKSPLKVIAGGTVDPIVLIKCTFSQPKCPTTNKW
jgi:hypothetical protein